MPSCETAFAPSSSSISNTRSTTAIFRACSAWWRTCWMQTSGTSHHPALARRVRLDAAVRHRPRHAGRRLQPVGRDDLLLVLGWRFPVHVYDLHTAYLATSNILLPYDPDEVRKKPRKRLSDACRAYGIEGWENIDKPEMAKAIGEGRWREYGREAVFDYCEEDVRNSAELLRRQIAGHGNRAPVDPELRHALERLQRQDRRADSGPRHADRHAAVESGAGEQAAVIAALIARFDPSQGSEDPIYSPDGEWSSWRFEHWLVAAGITEWPRLDPARSSSTATPSA